MHLGISVELESSQQVNLAVLAEDWQSLERDANCTVFLTWSWIGRWLAQLRCEYSVLKATYCGRVVGLAVIVKKTRWVFGVIPVEQWWLNRSGKPEFDQCWIEENKFLINKAYQTNVQEAMEAFIRQQQKWHEFVVGLADDDTQTRFRSLADNSRALIDDVGYAVDFNQVSDDYLLSVPSRNTRQKLKQSEKLLTTQGELEFSVSSDAKIKKLHFKQVQVLHRARWQNTSTPSGFDNPYFSHMLAQLIEDPNVELAWMSINGNVLGYLINFVYRNKVSFYLSALNKSSDVRIKIGMLLQQKAIQYYQQQGVCCYDFLAGDARYKQSLSNLRYAQTMVTYYRRHPALYLESIGRKSKRLLLSLMKKPLIS